MKAQADYTRDYLNRLPMRQELLERISKLSDTGTDVHAIQRRGELYFYYRRAPESSTRREPSAILLHTFPPVEVDAVDSKERKASRAEAETSNHSFWALPAN